MKGLGVVILAAIALAALYALQAGVWHGLGAGLGVFGAALRGALWAFWTGLGCVACVVGGWLFTRATMGPPPGRR